MIPFVWVDRFICSYFQNTNRSDVVKDTEQNIVPSKQ